MRTPAKTKKISTIKRPSKNTNKDIVAWGNLIKFIDGCADKKFLFRGTSSENFTLTPKAGRVKNYNEKKEKDIFDQFKRQAVNLIKDYTARSDSEWLAIGQHYGLPTRLLDWTSNPLIAAYFAVSGANPDNSANAKIFTFKATQQIPRIDDLTNNAYQNPFLITGEGIISPPWVVTRITAQRGMFTIHPYPNRPWLPTGLKTHLIPRESCDYIKDRLSQLGYDDSSILPGLDGVCSALSWLYES